MVPARAHLEGDIHSKDDERIYRERAQAHGYGDVHQFSRDHEIVHSLLAVWTGKPSSPALEWAARGCPAIDRRERQLHRAEESAVLMLQAYFKWAGLEIPTLARRHEKGPGG